MTQNNSKAENDCITFFKKDEHPTEDCKAEVEVVAVTAIDTDGIVGNGMGPVSVSVSGTKNFGGAVEGIQGGNTNFSYIFIMLFIYVNVLIRTIF